MPKLNPYIIKQLEYKTLAFIVTNDNFIFEEVDQLPMEYEEYHACERDEFSPGKYIRVIDRNLGCCGGCEIERIKLRIRIKSND